MIYLSGTDLRNQLRSAIKTETDELVRCMLEFSVDGLDRAIRNFNLNPHGDHLSVLNGAFINARRMLNEAGQKSQPKEMA
jgi:hypothetical protein